jgi:undecaprenyl pyrophosphate synthase
MTSKKRIFTWMNWRIRMQENELKIPNHIAIIMDGNGRWAKKKRMPRNYGHT